MENRAMRLYPAPVKTAKGTFWGFINKKGEFALEPVFEYALDFQPNGLAVVGVNNKYGLINEFGRFVVAPIYGSISSFVEGRAIVSKDDGYYVMNEQGILLTRKPYSYIGEYQESRAVFNITQNESSLYGYLELNGNEVIPAQYQTANDFKNKLAIVQTTDGVFQLIDQQGKVRQTYPYPFVGMQGDGLLAFKEKANYDSKYGVMTLAARVIIPPTYSSIQPFQDGLAVVNVSEDYTNKFGVINREGKYVIKPVYNEIIFLGEGRIGVGKAINEDQPYLGSTFAIATTMGTFLTDFYYTQVFLYENRYASASNQESTFFINRNGKIVQSLPIIKGIGTLEFVGDIIKANVDLRLSYYTLDGRQIWKQNTIIPLNRKYKVIEEKYRPNKNYLVYYPQIEGMRDVSIQNTVNTRLKDLSMSKETEENLAMAEYSADFDIQFFKKDLLVFYLNSYFFPFGAAHGTPSQVYPLVDLQTGVFYELKDLFKENSDYVKEISDIIEEQIKTDEQYSYVFPDAYKGISPNQPFYVSEEALFIYFPVYEIAPYVAGFPTFKIPFIEIDPILDKEGAFWRAFH
ncbi:MAG: WG repeat-containing protein [Bacillota bacterium]